MIEVGGRLVGQDQRRVVDQRPGDRHPLLLSARQLLGQEFEPLGPTDVTAFGLPRPEETTILRDASPRDLRVARWYRLLYLTGLVWMIFFAVQFVLPSAKVTLGWSLGVLFGAPVVSFYWWEGVLLLSFTLLDVTLPLIVLVRNRIRARRAAA